MKKHQMYFDADRWFGDIQVRSISPAARGLLADMAALMNRDRMLVSPGNKSFSSTQIARLGGHGDETCIILLEELHQAELIKVEDTGYSVAPGIFDFPKRRKQ